MLTVPEKYYVYLDQAWPTNLMIVADLDRSFPIDHVADMWTTFCTHRVLTRMQVSEDLRMIDAGTGAIDYRGCDMDSAHWDGELSRESRTTYGLGHSIRCRYLRSEDEQRSRLVLIGHHAIIDGRIGAAEMQAFVRSLDGQPVPQQTRISRPAAASEQYPWQRDRLAMLSLLQELREEKALLGAPGPREWPAADLPRHPRFQQVVIDRDSSAQIVAAGKAHGTGPLSAMAAAWLVASAGELCGATPTTLQLNTPVDVAARVDDPDQPSAMAVAVISGRYCVEPRSPWELAVEVAAGIRRALDRGEGDLFFHLARIAAIEDLEVGTRTVRNSISQAPPAVSVTNLGVIDPGSDPPWVRWICGYQAPTPNHVAFVSGSGYRGQLVNMVSTDDSRVSPEAAVEIRTGFRDVLTTMTPPSA